MHVQALQAPGHRRAYLVEVAHLHRAYARQRGATARDCTVVSVTATGASGPERSATYTNSSSKGTMTAINASVRRWAASWLPPDAAQVDGEDPGASWRMRATSPASSDCITSPCTVP